ncbi:condensation domain-containing protein, partial [Solibacillus sp. MA9]
NQLQNNDEIKEAVVVDREDKLGNKYLCAYVLSEKEIKELNLRAYLKECLPEYMIPSYFIKLEKMPLTNNGKLNRRELPAPNLVEILNEHQPPRNEIEEALAKVWIEVLGVDKIGINDNFYEIGGDSIKAIQISSKLKNLGLDIRVKDILTYESIDKIATTAQVMKSNKIIEDYLMEGTINNTPIIEWFFNENFLNEHSYNQYIQLEFKNSMDINNIRRSIEEIVGHHDSLRINYDKSAKKLFYNNVYLNKENINGKNIVEYINLSESSYDEQINKINENKNNLINGFDLENNTLFKLIVFNLGEGKQSLLFMAHHLIVDGISWRIILDDFLTVLKQLSNNEEVKLPMKTHSFKAWADALNEYSKKEFNKEKAYWKSILDKDVNYPVDFDIGLDTVRTANIVSIELGEDILNDLIKSVNEIYNLELNETLTIALVITLNNLTSRNEIVIELERHGREAINDYIDVSRTVGWFTSMYPTYFIVNHEDMNNTIKSLKEQLRNIPNKGFNYSILKFTNKQLTYKENKHIRLNYLGDFDTILDGERLNISNIKFGLDSHKNNLLTSLMDIDAMIVNRKLKISFTYSRNRFEDETVQKLIDNYVNSLKLILDQCANKDLKEYTPSDFDAAGISQEELDSIFD